MSTRINLLPDIRQAKGAENNRRRIAILAAIGTLAVGGGITVLLLLITQAKRCEFINCRRT